MGAKSSDSNYSGMPVAEDKRPSMFVSVLHLLVLASLLLFVVGGMIFKDDWADFGLPPSFVDCCAGLHVAIGFFCWWFPPLGVISIGYQIADSQVGERRVCERSECVCVYGLGGVHGRVKVIQSLLNIS